jgi:hypothetical protein
MTLFSTPRATRVLALAVAFAVSGMMAAEAGDGRHHRHRGHHARLKEIPRLEPGHHGGRLGTELRYGSDERYRQRPDRAYYGGAQDIWRGDGDSIYVYVDGDRSVRWLEDAIRPRASGPRIIHVTPGQDDCSWEAGVCVIRP